MGETLLTTLSMENYHPSTLLSMDSGSFTHEETERETNRSVILSGAPDINLPLSSEASPPPLSWNDHCDILDVGLGPQIYESEAVVHVPKIAKKYSKRVDSMWGAWFFFSFYFKPVLNEKSKSKITRDSNGLSGYDKTDLQLDAFMVQHDMENMYMWVFKEKPENALGKMQLRSYMNGHSRQGERPFPFSVDKGFVRSHRMQRKHYRGLSNPQCLHGIEVVRSPNLSMLDEDEKKRWVDLTGRDANFSVPPEASDYGSWRNLPHTEFELERPLPLLKANGHTQVKKLNGTCLNLSTHSPDHATDAMDIYPTCGNKRKKDCLALANGDESCSTDKSLDMKFHAPELPWSSEFTGVMKNINGPVTAAKTVYEDANGFLIIISLPLVDLGKVKVTWRNTPGHGIVKISCVSTTCMPFIKRHDRTFKLSDPAPEHCPPGEFVREISLPNRIPDDAKLEAYRDETGTMLEIMVPKHRTGPEEHEVRVCLRPFELE
ncbi:PREDICTED: uncharacterized protein LOC104799350 [Tarenaya hassleriana]|uniref:uncharacterized protein LOC104799350 n=1 Tax=Tarenaya hassleriana TaxID=28532 RepID=UPI00053CA75A|nr:PREDICTED: uncharacterized protein LOC104799350 [Tarenaya hassleriana]XP_010520120.1 PREDICTED: uncharacterized protein LOC104799350 [Tarenaya hassleriana]